MLEKLKFGATVKLEQIRDGKIIDTREIHNLVVNAGYDLVRDLLAKQNDRPNPIQYIALGTGNSATTVTMTALQSQWGNRYLAVYAPDGSDHTLFTLSQTIPAHTGGTAALTESGLFTAATGGTMFDRVTFSVINKEPADTIIITYTINLVDTE